MILFDPEKEDEGLLLTLNQIIMSTKCGSDVLKTRPSGKKLQMKISGVEWVLVFRGGAPSGGEEPGFAEVGSHKKLSIPIFTDEFKNTLQKLCFALLYFEMILVIPFYPVESPIVFLCKAGV